MLKRLRERRCCCSIRLPGAQGRAPSLAGLWATAAMGLGALVDKSGLGSRLAAAMLEVLPLLVVAMQLGGERLKPAQTLCLLLALATFLVLLPLDCLWWRLLRWI